MLRDYAESFGSSAGHTAIKRNVNHFDKDSFSKPRSKRICTSNAQWRCQQYVHEQNNIKHKQQQQQQQRDMTDVGFLTPATTPAEVITAQASLIMDNISSPYSEAEDYMVRGYYEDDGLIYNSRSCVESVQYNLYDMTPEEYELNNGDASEINDYNATNAILPSSENKSALLLGGSDFARDQVAFDDINNEVMYYESSDINM